ncbi:hypothetical protein BC628DRAFT_268346 [Trametes gibbosa]|nr:hypothetical protein BC628DRAFT_268346 [Trametes gibbosa]
MYTTVWLDMTFSPRFWSCVRWNRRDVIEWRKRIEIRRRSRLGQQCTIRIPFVGSGSEPPPSSLPPIPLLGVSICSHLLTIVQDDNNDYISSNSRLRTGATDVDGAATLFAISTNAILYGQGVLRRGLILDANASRAIFASEDEEPGPRYRV